MGNISIFICSCLYKFIVINWFLVFYAIFRWISWNFIPTFINIRSCSLTIYIQNIAIPFFFCYYKVIIFKVIAFFVWMSSIFWIFKWIIFTIFYPSCYNLVVGMGIFHTTVRKLFFFFRFYKFIAFWIFSFFF